MGLQRSSRFHAVPVVLVLVFAGVAVACAKGETPDLGGLAVAETSQATDPPPPSQKVPPPAPTPAPTGDEDSGTGSSSGQSSSGGSSSGGSSSGAVDAGGTDAGSSSSGGSSSGAVDAGTCATVAPSNACGLTPQCGCAANQTCDVTNNTTGAVSCVLAGGGPVGSYCTTTTQCANGLTCGYNTCRPYCATAGAACAGANLGQCTQYYDPTAGTAVPNSKVCTIACDLRSPSAACGSNNCIFDTTINATDCDKSGTKALYAACTRYNDCQQGLACTQHPLFGFECEKWCRIGQSDCGLLETCTDVYGAAAPSSGGAKLGHCQ
jgi:hypothetical protein